MTKVMFEDVEIGGGPEAVTKVVTPRQLVQYAAVSQDFTPIHYNRDYARSASHDDIIIHGALKTALLSQMLADWAGDIGAVKKSGNVVPRHRLRWRYYLRRYRHQKAGREWCRTRRSGH